MKNVCVAFFMTSLATIAWAHPVAPAADGWQLGDGQVAVSAELAATWRSHALVSRDEVWHVNGALMGGEALPPERGVTLDDARLGVHWRADRQWVVLEAGSHGHGLELEHAWLGYDVLAADGVLTAEIGRMAGRFSPENERHAAGRLFSEAPLVLDVLLGRHFVDNGARLQWSPGQGLTLGFELWQGGGFPASTGASPNYDVFVDWQGRYNRLAWRVGGWYFLSRANQREDERYGSGHSHGGGAQGSGHRFSGKTRMYGVHGELAWQVNDRLTVVTTTEWLWVEPDGILTDEDETRSASLHGEYLGGWVTLAGQVGPHTLGVRYEELSLRNTLVGTSAPQLAADSGLINHGHNPQRLGIAYRYQVTPQLSLRVEGLRDDWSAERTRDRAAMGVTWRL